MHILLRGGITQRLRIATGLILFTFATTHFLNHALGLVSALSLLVEHALRHCRDGSRVRLCALAPENPSAPATTTLRLDAVPTGFTSMAWQALAARAVDGPRSQGQLRVETAVRIIDACGGSVELAATGGADMCVHIQLRLVTARPGAANDSR
jgi:hypothetical protein